MLFRFVFHPLLTICMCSSLWGNTLDMARRITGHYEPESPVARLHAPAWDSAAQENRNYLGPMDCAPSRVFRSAGFPDAIDSLEDLEDTIYHMHRVLQPTLDVHFRSREAQLLMEQWIEKVNTIYSIRCRLVDKKGKFQLQVAYSSDARVFAAFRNPELESRLLGKERDLLDVCGQWISRNIQPGMPNMLKIRKIHDALVDNSKYTKGHYSTEEIVLNGEGVCAAYTSATQLLLHMVMIDCRSVLGTEKMNHIWNIIDVNGEWYHADVTWDDPIMPDNSDVKVFNYYLLTKAEMEMDHEWPNQDFYPETPEINRIGIFKRQAHRESTGDPEKKPVRNPREEESIFDIMEERFKADLEEQGDKMADILEPVHSPVSSPAAKAADPVVAPLESLGDSLLSKKKKSDAPEYKTIKTEADLYENLRISQEFLDGPTLEFMVDPGMAYNLPRADYHHYFKYWNYRFDKEKNMLYLDIVHWPHIRLLRSVDNEKNREKLTPEERRTLNRCKALAHQYGTAWKTDKQKVRDLYTELVRNITWEPGASDVSVAALDKKSGSLGYSETLHTVLSLMRIPCIMVHGRTLSDVHAWNMVRRASGRWYHASAALDDAEGNRHEHSFEYFLRCDDEVYESLVWDLDETYPTPVKSKKKAAEFGLQDRKKKAPEHAPQPETTKPSLLPAL